MTELTIGMPPPCHVCGAKAGENHVKECAWLSCLRASAYPSILDENGLEWETNLISKLQRENKYLRDSIKSIQAIRGEDDFLVYRECEQALSCE